MRQFIGKVIVEQNGNWWMLWHAFWYEDDNDEQPVMVRVPRGFITDFASVPKPLWNILPPNDYRYTAAAIVHDRLYETHDLSRSAADAIFFNAMGIKGTPLWKRWLMWAAVRTFGGAAYRSGPLRQKMRLAVSNFQKKGVVKLNSRKRKEK